MKYIFNLISSTKLTIILLITLAIGMGAATFIENSFDTVTAKRLVYNSSWFEFLLLLLAFNFIANIKKYNLLKKRKLVILVFHLSFVVMILGAGITRYISFEGTMHIREGGSSDVIYTAQMNLQIYISDVDKPYEIPLNLSDFGDKSFNLIIDNENSAPIEIEYNKYIKNAVEKVVENVEGGINMIELLTVVPSGDESVIFLKYGEFNTIGDLRIVYSDEYHEDAINVIEKEGKLNIISPYEIVQSKMGGKDPVTFAKDTLFEFKEKLIYNTQGILFLFKKYYQNAKIHLVPGASGEVGVDALAINVIIKDKKHEVTILDGAGSSSDYQVYKAGSQTIKFAFGNKRIRLPFSIYLKDFILDRYPGSNSPSSFASEVTLIDERKGLQKDYRIFMNNVLDYNGYRFFQSSYDSDERGTILSVNHDFYGTWISYLGYLLMGVGFLLTLINKNSRFIIVVRNIRKIREKRKAVLTVLALILGMNAYVYSQEGNENEAYAQHAEKFGHLIVQTYDGRFEPVHTLAYDVMHKISRKDKFEIEGKGKMDGIHVFLDMHIDADFWKQQKIIYIREEPVRDIIGIDGKYASYNDFFKENYEYKLLDFAENAFRKKQSERNKFEKGIIKVDERINICMMVFNRSLLKIFPEQSSINNTWISINDKSAFVPLTGNVKIINEDLQLDVLSYNNILLLYLNALTEAKKTGNYSKADKLVGYFESIQRGSTANEILPSNSKVNMEVNYNKSRIFIKLKKWYGSLSVILLLLAFIANIRTKNSKILNLLLYFFIILLGLAFLYHTYGMGLRWYLSGHAPWSNGYEALILVAWGGLLAGFCFIRYSKITLAATALLAFFTLMTASHSSYDPQLTNLQPVLKSYWLIIHVASITISYGFLGLGFILGFINLLIYMFKTIKSANRLNLILQELTYINEMTLTIGIVLATIGTFLGGVWANESWGRYWGWDAKETWALIIIITYAIILHLRLVPKLKSIFIFNVASIIGFASVIMTFIGVNYYLTKGLHSYGSGNTPIFPLWAWATIISLIIIIIVAAVKERLSKSSDT